MTVQQGRVTTELPVEGAVLFLIGMRINLLWQVWKWFPVFVAMPRMIAELMKNPALGLRGRPRTFVSGRTILVWQQWTSFDALESYARASEHLHLPAWRAFNRRTRGNASVGIYHETYLLDPGSVEAMYVNMPPFGLGAAFGTRAPDGRSNTAAQRLGRTPSQPVSTDTDQEGQP
jgi:hypothetical protein